jgi:hypothetical protein
MGLLGPGVVSIDYELPAREDAQPQPRSRLGPGDLFALYYRRHHAAEPEAAVTDAFDTLLAQAAR